MSLPCGPQSMYARGSNERTHAQKLNDVLFNAKRISQKKYPGHRYTQRLQKLNAVYPLNPSFLDTELGQYVPSKNCLTVSLAGSDNVYDTVRMNTILFHEIAHAIADPGDTEGHGPRFRAALVFAYRLATRDMGLKIYLVCTGACHNHNFCSAEAKAVPLITWDIKPNGTMCGRIPKPPSRSVKNPLQSTNPTKIVSNNNGMPPGLTFTRRCKSMKEDQWREPKNQAERDLLVRLKTAMWKFANHLRTKYPNDPRTKNLLSKWTGDIKITTKDTGAMFTWSGCMVVNPYSITKSDTVMDPEYRMITRVLHELAHSTGFYHDKDFYDTHRFFVKVATEELGMRVDVNCRICCESQVPCKQVCPKCTWLDNDGVTVVDPTKCHADVNKCRPDKEDVRYTTRFVSNV